MQYADVALPNAVRQVFTYGVRESMQDDIRTGMRVWVPFGTRKAIGMVVRLHDRKPDFRCRYVCEILDSEPLLTDELLSLTEWIGSYYYAGWGEVIQAALPAGLNYVSERYVRVAGALDKTYGAGQIAESDDVATSADKQAGNKIAAVRDEIAASSEVILEEAEKRWGVGLIRKLIKSGVLELREVPRVKVKPLMVKALTWDQDDVEAWSRFISSYSGKRYAWIEVAGQLLELKPPVLQRLLTDEYGFSAHAIRRIEKEGFIRAIELEQAKAESLALDHRPDRLRALNDTQMAVFKPILEAMNAKRFESFLLYGVTGSGKTEVYIHALKKAYDVGQGGLVLVPEIALTPQTVRRFYEIFGDDIAVLHSRLNERERFEAWKALRKGEKRIAIGARSAVFAPVQNLGIIIVDEEHDNSYKQEDPAPRYNARDVAILRASMSDIPVILGSATPNLITLNGVSRNKHTLLKLESRHREIPMPEVKILDLRQYRHAMRGSIAVPLYQAILDAISRKEQVILLHNRRGFASYQQCDACGHVPECPHCSVSLTWHRKAGTLRCHYCGFSKRSAKECGSCGEAAMDHKGFGTQKVEEELSEIFPNVRILRMDRDTTAKRDAHAKILNSFGRGEADILVGTQLVAKGLDFPNVTVVGVINADTELAFPSYRSSERMFQLLTQVAGRSGRAEKTGTVYLQTRQPEHPALIHASKHDFEGFARYELSHRKPLRYPPFSRLIQFQFKSDDEQRVAMVAEAFTKILSQVFARHTHQHAVLGPAPSAILKIYNDYRWETFVKLDLQTGPKLMEKLIDAVFTAYESQRPEKASTVRINVNVDAG